MLTRLLFICFSFLFLSVNPKEQTSATSKDNAVMATCYGKDPCHACKNCKYCKHCAKDGGTTCV